MPALFLKDDLVLLIAQGGQIAVVPKIEEFLARVGGFAGEIGGLVVTVEVDLEGFAADFHAFEELFLQVGDAGGGEQRGKHVFV